jgi:hypothetical protein
MLMLGTLTGCAVSPPGAASGGLGADALHRHAQDILAAFSSAASQAGGSPPAVFVGELTGQIGDWEEPVGENNKLALMSGAVDAGAPLSDSTPPAGEIRWPDGSSRTVRLRSAARALIDLKAASGSPCSDCRPLVVTAAALANGSAQTSRGAATVPTWNFTIAGTHVIVTRVAVDSADRIALAPVPWNRDLAPQARSIQSATGAAMDRTLTVEFVGAPDPGSKPCGADYAAEAVESTLAIVVIVMKHANPAPVVCPDVGAFRTAPVALAAPLGDRVVLEIEEGLPVPVSAP